MTNPDLKPRRGHVDRSETFDEFLERDGLLAMTEETPLKEIIADQIKAAIGQR